MENPFELILKRLDVIENLLRNIPQPVIQANSFTEVLNLEQAAEYVSLSKSAIYKKTSERNIPHFKQGKKLYFKRSELDAWLTPVFRTFIFSKSECSPVKGFRGLQGVFWVSRGAKNYLWECL